MRTFSKALRSVREGPFAFGTEQGAEAGRHRVLDGEGL